MKEDIEETLKKVEELQSFKGVSQEKNQELELFILNLEKKGSDVSSMIDQVSETQLSLKKILSENIELNKSLQESLLKLKTACESLRSQKEELLLSIESHELSSQTILSKLEADITSMKVDQTQKRDKSISLFEKVRDLEFLNQDMTQVGCRNLRNGPLLKIFNRY